MICCVSPRDDRVPATLNAPLRGIVRVPSYSLFARRKLSNWFRFRERKFRNCDEAFGESIALCYLETELAQLRARQTCSNSAFPFKPHQTSSIYELLRSQTPRDVQIYPPILSEFFQTTSNHGTPTQTRLNLLTHRDTSIHFPSTAPIQSTPPSAIYFPVPPTAFQYLKPRGRGVREQRPTRRVRRIGFSRTVTRVYLSRSLKRSSRLPLVLAFSSVDLTAVTHTGPAVCISSRSL